MWVPAGSAVPLVHLSCSADAVNKLSHFKACGTAQTDLVPCSTCCFAESNDHAKASFDAQNLGVEIEQEVKTCSSALSCAELSAKAGRVVDIFGILAIGPVCPHGTPAKGLNVAWGHKRSECGIQGLNLGLLGHNEVL